MRIKEYINDITYFFEYAYYQYFIPALRKKAIVFFHNSGEKRDKFLARYGGER